ncbi:MAG TPA: GAF domain-containing protein [Thermoleophilaceae bacterium]|nr:GAF domain-containing protein [Thermoleophilaceae bacterium]
MSSDEGLTQLQALLAEQAALRRVATMVAAGTPAPALFDRVCEELGKLLAVKATDMIRYEDEPVATVVGSWTEGETPSFPVGERVPAEGDTVTAKIRRSGRPERVDDYEHVEGELAARLREFGIRSVVGAPIHVAGRLWGALMASSELANAYPPETEARIGSFAELVTAALANVDAREQLAASRARIVEAADAARQRIERDLHDGAQQRLVSLALSLRLVESNLEPGSAATRELAAARAELDAALEELRELARGIHPSILTDRGLEAALGAVAGRCTVPVELHLDGCGKLPLSVATTAYFVVAEALTNASKHANADRIEVRVAVVDGHGIVEVRDDGIGGVDPARGSGLSGLADRVSALGGTLEIESPVGAGTEIRARIPVPAPGDGSRQAGAAVEYAPA